MGRGGEDGCADYKACAVCTRVCQTTHGKELPYSVPRFFKAVPDYSTPASKNCYMQIPAVYVREHIGKGAKSFVLEGVTGSEWEVTFKNIGLCGGWKAFAIDYHLEKGDQIMFGLVAPNRFYVNVFDKSGMEKVCTKEVLNQRGSTSTVIDKEADLLPQNEIHQVSNSTSEVAEGFHTPLQMEHRDRCGEQKSNGVDEFPSETTSPQRKAQFLDSNGVCADITPVMVCGQNGTHEGVQNGGASGFKLQDNSPPEDAHSPQVGHRLLSRTLEFDPTRALIEKLLIRDPAECDELETPGMSDSMSESEDSVQVLLAKAVLAKMRRKKLKNRKSSCVANQAEIETEATKSGGIVRTAVSTLSLNEDKAVNIKFRNGDWRSKVLANLGTDTTDRALRGAQTGARGETVLEEAMPEKSCEEPGDRVDGSNGQTESHMCSIQAEPHHKCVNGAGVSNGDGLKESQDFGNGVRVEVVQDIPQPDHRQNEIMAMDAQVARAGVVNREDSVLQRAGECCNQPSSVLAVLVKEEPDLSDALGPEMTAAGAYNETCANCGHSTTPYQDQIYSPPTNLALEFPEARTPSSDALNLRRSLRLAEEQKQEALQGAKVFSASISRNLAIRTPSSNGPRRPKGYGIVTEDQKQKAIESARTFSANTTNPSAVVVMRISFVEKTYACFVSVKCAIMLPQEPTEIILVDSKGNLRNVNWRPERRYMQGLGWKDFVDSNNLHVNDVCVMEVIDSSSQLYKVHVHIFHAHEMDTSNDKQEDMIEKEEAREGKEAQRENERPHAPGIAAALRNIKAFHESRARRGLLPPTKRRKRRQKLPTIEAVQPEAVLTMPASSNNEIPEPDMQLTIPSTEETKKHNPGNESSMEQEVVIRTNRPRGGRRGSKGKMPKVRKLPQPSGIKEPEPALRGDKYNHFRRHYSVVKLVDRRKSLHGCVFLVELKEPVILNSAHKKFKAKQDEKGRWWVPHSHFTSDFSSCYIE